MRAGVGCRQRKNAHACMAQLRSLTTTQHAARSGGRLPQTYGLLGALDKPAGRLHCTLNQPAALGLLRAAAAAVGHAFGGQEGGQAACAAASWTHRLGSGSLSFSACAGRHGLQLLRGAGAPRSAHPHAAALAAHHGRVRPCGGGCGGQRLAGLAAGARSCSCRPSCRSAAPQPHLRRPGRAAPPPQHPVPGWLRWHKSSGLRGGRLGGASSAAELPAQQQAPPAAAHARSSAPSCARPPARLQKKRR